MTTAPDLIRPLLSEYLDGELPAEDGARVDAHLPGCAGCAGELAQMRAASQALRRARQEPSAAAIHALRGDFRSVLAERAAGGGWTFRLLPQLAAAGIAAALLIAAGALMVPRLSRRAASMQAKNSVVYIRPEESGSARDEKTAHSAASAMSAPAAASVPAADAPPSGGLAYDRAAPGGYFAPAPAAQPLRAPVKAPMSASVVVADAEKKAKQEADLKANARQAVAEKPASDARDLTRTAAAGTRADLQEDRAREKDEPADNAVRYASMPTVAISNLWVRGAGGAAAAPATDDRPATAGAGHSTGAIARADETPAAKAAAPASEGAPPATEAGLARRADCHPAPPEFPAFPGLHPGDADRLPLTVVVTIDGGGHVVKAEPRAGPAQMPLAIEIRNWLRGQRVRPMICNGEGVAATLTLTFTWPGG